MKYFNLTVRYSNRIALSFIIIALVLITACSNNKINSQWQSGPVSIDGLSDDWDPAILTYEEKLKLVYGITNDQDKIRFIIQFKDRRLASRIDMYGMVIWLNKEKTCGIRYIDEMLHDQMRERILSGDGFNPRRDRERDQQRSFLAGSFFWIDKETETEIDPSNSVSYRAAASLVDGNFCLEYDISRSFLEETDVLKAGIEISGIDEELKEAIEERMKQRMSGGRRGGPGMGGMGGGRGRMAGDIGNRPGGARRGMQGEFEKLELWFSVHLANQPE